MENEKNLSAVESSYKNDPITKIEKRRKDKSDIATVDKVLDKRTIEVLNKLIKREKLFDLSGSVSTGKEANIYTAKCSNTLISKFIKNTGTTENESIIPVVLKIYKTSTMMFKDRTRYIIDEKRFKNFCTSNSRKLIKVWSEKEVRNLKRMIKGGIPCPEPLYLKKSILIMTMIGDLSPAPKLKDVILIPSEWERVYNECIGLIKDLYQKAKLIHADFSEYNLVYHKNKVFVIDVSQSMDIYQENSNSFLMMDIFNCNEFFQKKGICIKSEIEIFEGVTNLKIPEYLKVDGKLNKECFIPTRIMEVANKEDLGLFIDDSIIKNLEGLHINNDKDQDDSEELDIDDNDNEDSNEDISEYSNESDNEDIDQDISECSNECISDCSDDVSNDIFNIEDEPETRVIDNKDNIAHFYDFSNINLYVRRLRLKNPEISKEQEKEINKIRKSIIKSMNKERRIKRVERKEEYKTKKAKKRNIKQN